MNDSKEPPKLVSLSDTRWLIWFPAVKQILDQWLELKTFFTMAASDKNFTAEKLSSMYHDQTNLLYLTFLKPVLQSLSEINIMFQSTRADIGKLYLQLRTLIFAFAARFLAPRFFKTSEETNGFRQIEVEMLQKALTTPQLTKQQLAEVKTNCANFLVTLTKRLLEKLPNNLETIQNLRFITPTAALTSKNRPKLYNY